MKNRAKRLKKKAEEAFLRKEYETALVYYALALPEDPADQELRIGAILSDMANDLEDEAQALFGYYLIVRDENRETASEMLQQLIRIIDENISKIGDMIAQPLSQIAEAQNGITYEDFRSIVAQKESFAEAYEDVLFSTRVVISKKEDLLDFIELLIDNGYDEAAMGYIESANSFFPTDFRIQALAEKIVRKGGVSS